MGLFSRSSGAAEAVHARVADGEHLWLAVRGAETLALVGAGHDIDVPATSETHGDDVLLTAVLPLAEVLAADTTSDLELRLCHGRKRQPVAAAWAPRPATPTLEAPTTVDRRWQLSVHDVEGAVVVRRSPVAPVVPVLAISTVDDGVAVRLGGATSAVTVGGVTLPVTDGVLVIGEVADLPLDTNLPLLADGVPVARTRNVMDKPHFATAFPALPSADVELRWLRDGRLALFRRSEPATRAIA